MKYYKIMKNITKTKKMILLAIMAVVSSVSYAATNLSLRFTADDAGDITSSKTIGAFTMVGTSDKKITIASSNKTIDNLTSGNVVAGIIKDKIKKKDGE